MDIFQTPSSEKKNMWHIYEENFGDYVTGLCHCSPSQKDFNPKCIIFTGIEKLCPACVAQAYIKGIITITGATQ